mmetsp:Transcript_57786/g.126639  ORF Transcript_57786/g.126639 Transcript_57786/m.126639 type:complete len:97 (+) Transcript_57786:526-816(+)
MPRKSGECGLVLRAAICIRCAEFHLAQTCANLEVVQCGLGRRSADRGASHHKSPTDSLKNLTTSASDTDCLWVGIAPNGLFEGCRGEELAVRAELT